MPNRPIPLLLLAATLLAAVAAAAAPLRREAPIDASTWDSSGDGRSCTLAHKVPGFGLAEFERAVANPMVVRLRTARDLPAGSGKVTITAQPPGWKPGRGAEGLGTAPFRGGRIPVEASGPVVDKSLTSLENGMFPTFRFADPVSGHATDIVLSALNFRTAYGQFLSCIIALVPDFAAIKEKVVHYELDKTETNDEAREYLDLVVEYAKAGPGLRKVVVHGHSDTRGTKAYNRKLSQRRGDAIKEYLVAKGVSDKIIEVIAHGENQPLVKPLPDEELPEEEEAKNRRTEIQLFKR